MLTQEPRPRAQPVHPPVHPPVPERNWPRAASAAVLFGGCSHQQVPDGGGLAPVPGTPVRQSSELALLQNHGAAHRLQGCLDLLCLGLGDIGLDFLGQGLHQLLCLDEVYALDVVLDFLDQLHFVHGLCLC